MKKKVLIKSIAAMLLGLLIASSAILPNGWGGDHPDPEMAVIEYNINI